MVCSSCGSTRPYQPEAADAVWRAPFPLDRLELGMLGLTAVFAGAKLSGFHSLSWLLVLAPIAAPFGLLAALYLAAWLLGVHRE
jgi:hypothetical protein